MELVLLIVAGIGALLFIIAYLAFVLGGFKHHFITGIISALPVLNIVTLPSLMHKSKGKLILSTLGLIIFLAAWFLGANNSIPKLIAGKRDFTEEKVILSSSPESSLSEGNNIKQNKTKSSKELDGKNMVSLPGKALYNMAFVAIPAEKISSLQGRIIQVTLSNNVKLEGRLQSVNAGSFYIEGEVENEMPISKIKELKLMVKKAKP